MRQDKKAILIIEDNKTNMLLFKEMLELDGRYNVLTAYNGKDGLELIKKTPPDLLILDIFLPDIGGIEIKNIIREDSELTKVIILAVSASVTKEEKERFSKEFIHFMEKPIDVKTFLKEIARLLENPSLNNKKIEEAAPKD